MLSEIVVVCKCPVCGKTYKQEVRRGWTGNTYRPRGNETALRALCAQAAQRDGKREWAGLAYCADCSTRKCPPAIRGQVEKWTRQGEIS